MNQATRILYIVHDGQIYGSQQSLLLILDRIAQVGMIQAGPAKSFANPVQIEPYVSLARDGALKKRLKQISGVTICSHKRLQWFKHDKRHTLQKIGDVLNLLWNIPCRTHSVYRLIKKHRIDIVHTNSVVSLEGALAAKLAGIKHIWHIRELFIKKNPKLVPVLGESLSRWLIIHLSDHVISISEAVATQFKNTATAYTEKISVVYNALPETLVSVDTEHRPPNAKADHDPFHLGYIGRLSIGKGFHDLIHALGYLRAQNPLHALHKLIVVGQFVDHAYQQTIENLIQEYNLQDQIVFCGYQSDLSTIYPNIDLMIIPSHHEPFGRVVIEAMGQCIPCIGSDSGGIPEIIVHNETGWLFQTGNSLALAHEIEACYQLPSERQRIVKNAGRMIAERFTMEKQWPKLLAIYQQVSMRR